MIASVESRRLFALGGAHIDRRGQTFAAFVPGASNPGHMREDIGGGAFNAVRTAVQRGICAALLSVHGGDAAGRRVAEAIVDAGIEDLSAVFLDRATPSYTAIVDKGGEVVAALADMDLYEVGFPRQVIRRKVRDAIASSDAILCDANLPARALVRVAALSSGRPLHAVAISPAKVVRLRPVLAKLATLFMNRREAVALAGLSADPGTAELVNALRGTGLQRGAISDGGRPLVAFTPREIVTITPPVPDRIADVTGAGDALAGAAIAALMRGRNFTDALREGMAASYLVLMSADAATEIAAPAFDHALTLVPEPVALT